MERFLDVVNKLGKEIADLEAKLAESKEQVKHWHDLYNDRDKQFQSVRQRYHLLNKLQSNYDKKDKLHLAYMQCAELVEENEKLKQQLAEKEKEIERLREINLDVTIKQMQFHHNQDKINFAVERLEKVKYSVLDFSNGYWRYFMKNGKEYMTSSDLSSCLKEYVDDSIKELKEMR